jgi:hypothetical protein
MGKTKPPVPEYSDAVCRCGRDVATVKVAGNDVLIDRDEDERGEIHSFRMAGRLIFTVADTSSAGSPGPAHRRHRCPHTMHADTRRALDKGDTEGPCAGHCGQGCPCGCKGRVPNRYGPNFDMMCTGCKARHAARMSAR